jgi:hypothetical protein
MQQPNYYLKALLIQSDGTIINAARSVGIHESRLSRIIHRRVRPNQKERQKIAWHLQRSIEDVFQEQPRRNNGTNQI